MTVMELTGAVSEQFAASRVEAFGNGSDGGMT